MQFEENVPQDDEVPNREVRPKLHSSIAYKVVGDEHWRSGRISGVGKKDGIHKFRCWVKNRNRTDDFDFIKDISEWKYWKVEFENTAKDSDDTCGIVTEVLYTGVRFLQNKNEVISEAEPDTKIQENLVYVLN